jgi:HPt (histidine-containing phosphotransfer) domain-containing protein
MTIQELYQNIGGDYDQAVRVLRMDKLIDKHIRKFTANGVVDGLLDCKDAMNPSELFEASHAVKGVTANLGLMELSDIASEIAEEFRPGNERKLSDEDVRKRIEAIREIYDHTVKYIQKYEES